MRTPDLECLLCQKNLATQTNSHIVSKFLIKSMFGDSRKAFSISSSRADRPPIINQDSPKEDFILCPECEKYLSQLENYFMNNIFRKISDIRYGQFFYEEGTIVGLGIKTKTCLAVIPIAIQLFIFSIIWRCSISNHDTFKLFRIDSESEEGLRKSLLNYKSLTTKDLYDAINSNSNFLYPIKFVLITYEGYFDSTNNILSALPMNNPFGIFMNQYILIFSFTKNQRQDGFGKLNNTTPSDDQIKIGIANIESWMRLRDLLLHAITESSFKNLKEASKEPYLIDDQSKWGLG